MLEPFPVSTSAAYVDRLISRLVLLHHCYEQAVDELDLPRMVSAQQESLVSFPDPLDAAVLPPPLR